MIIIIIFIYLSNSYKLITTIYINLIRFIYVLFIDLY